MIRGSIFWTVFGLSLLVACAGETGAPAEFVVEEAVLDFGDVMPSGGTRTAEIRVVNIGGTTATLLMVNVEVLDKTCGTFRIDADEAWAQVAPGDATAVPVDFVPDPGCFGGCDCHAYGVVRLEFDAEPGLLEVPVVVRGDCARSVRCTPNAVDFERAFLDRSVKRTVVCRNLGDAPVTVSDLSLREDASSALALDGSGPSLPAVLSPFASTSFKVRYAPKLEGEDFAVLLLETDEGTVEIAVSGFGEPRFPSCSAGIPPAPSPVLVRGDATMTLEADPGPHDFSETVRARWYYDEGAGTIADILIARGCYADESTPCWQEGHLAKCEQCSETVEFWNIHAVPHDDTVDAWIRRIEVGDRLVIRGWEVAEILFPGGAFRDRGCNTLIVTWVCFADS